MTMRWYSAALLVVGLAMILPLGHGGEQQMTVLTAKDNDAKVKLVKDATLVVRLDGTAGTGFGWSIAKIDKNVLKHLGEPKIVMPDGAKKIGGARVWEFTFKAAAGGITDLALEYKRPFEKDKPPAKSFKAIVVVE